MRRASLILLSLVLALAGWSTANAQNAFNVSAFIKAVPKTGQTVSYAAGDDGALQKGVNWTTPRFTDNGNGTVTDSLTGLIWLKNANAFGQRTWGEALNDANNLANGSAGLTDGSKAGDWRLPNLREFQSLLDYGHYDPCLLPGHPFAGVQNSVYWSSTTCTNLTASAWLVSLRSGYYAKLTKADSYRYVWCVRGGPL